MTDLALGLRLALAGGRARALLTVLGSAVGVVVLLLATSVPSTLSQDLSVDDRRFAVVVVVFLALPVASLLASTSRLSAAVRDRRLAALRLLGVSAARTRRIAAVEALLLSTTGVAAGAVSWALVARPALQAGDERWRQFFDGRPLVPGTQGWLLATLGVPLLALVVSLAPVRSLTGEGGRRLLGTRRQASARRPGWWRVLPLAAGLALLALAAAAPSAESGPTSRQVAAFFAGAGLSGLALPLVVPVAVRLAADVLARLGRGPAALIAARRLQQEPAATTRLVAALLVALFVVAGGRCVLVTFESTPQYARAVLAASAGPQRSYVSAGPGAQVTEAELRAVPGVRAVLPVLDTLAVGCTPAERASFPDGGPSFCGTPLVGRCADLAQLGYGVSGCRDDRASWLRLSFSDPQPRPPAAELVRSDGSTPETTRVAVLSELGEVTVVGRADDPNWSPSGSLFVPSGFPEIAGAVAAATQFEVVTDGGESPVEALQRAVGDRAVVSGEDLTDLRVVQGYRAVLYAVAGVVLTVGLLALLLTGIDRAVERRRHLAGLAVLGVPPRVVRRSQLLQSLVPLGVGLPLAGGSGLLAGTAYLSLIGERASTPWPAVTALVAGATAAGALTALATVAGLGGRLRPTDLRRE